MFQDPGMIQDPDPGPGLDPDWISRTKKIPKNVKKSSFGTPRVRFQDSGRRFGRERPDLSNGMG